MSVFSGVFEQGQGGPGLVAVFPPEPPVVTFVLPERPVAVKGASGDPACGVEAAKRTLDSRGSLWHLAVDGRLWRENSFPAGELRVRFQAGCARAVSSFAVRTSNGRPDLSTASR